MIRATLDALDLVAVAVLGAMFSAAMVPLYTWKLIQDRAGELRRRRDNLRRRGRLGLADAVASNARPLGK